MTLARFTQDYRTLLLAAAGIVLLAVSLNAFGRTAVRRVLSPAPAELATSGSAGDPQSRPCQHPVVIHEPEGPPRIETGHLDELGRPVTVSCASCHDNFESNPKLRAGQQLVEFHQGLHFAHGQLSCLTCHNADNYNTLRLADGRALEYSDVQTLCAQCHTSQARDYERGAHGGMTGYWDLTRGGRQRKSCLDCHDPHSPAFPPMKPQFKPLDRFLSLPSSATEASHD